MPEGDTIFRAAQTLSRALRGATVTRFESMFPALNRVADDRPLAGRTIESVISRGKHLLIRFSGDLVLQTHMRMHGSWHLYRPGERWRRPAKDLRILVATDSFVAVGFDVPVAAFLTSRQLAEHKSLKALGPDLLDEDFDAGEAARRMRGRPNETIGELLLDQTVMAGIGNVFRSEILFAACIDPFAHVGLLSDEEIARTIATARTLLRASVLTRAQTLARTHGRRTTRSMDPAASLWVYGRGGKPCRRCGSPVRGRRTGGDSRVIYWCARCQERVIEPAGR